MHRQKVAIVTGGARGLGKMTALALAEMGCDVAVNYVKSRDEAETLCESIRGAGVRAIAVQANVAKPSEVRAMIDAVRSMLGPIGIAVNNAGPFTRERRAFAEYTSEEIEFLIGGNLVGPMELDRLVIPDMRAGGWGRIIHFGFGHAAEARGWQHRAVYAAAKVGLASFTKSLAVEEAPYGITVNMICPGDIKGAYKEQRIEEARGETDPESPRGRPGTGEDVARVVAFLCGEQSDYLTGNIIDVTGGLDPIRSFAQVNRNN